MKKTIEERAKELCEKESWSYELIEPLTNALLEVRNETLEEVLNLIILECKFYSEQFSIKRAVVLKDFADKVRERIKGKV